MKAPQIVVLSIISKEGKILLVKRAREPEIDKWSIIGGISIMRDEFSSDPLQASKDEVDCDIGCAFKKPEFFTYSYREGEKPSISLFFYGEIHEEPQINEKYVSAYQWFSPEEIKNLNIAFDNKAILTEFIKSKMT